MNVSTPGRMQQSIVPELHEMERYCCQLERLGSVESSPVYHLLYNTQIHNDETGLFDLKVEFR